MDKEYIVHTMGKAGSMSIYTALFTTSRDVKHCHTLVPLGQPDEDKQYIIISPIREAVSRNISAYFENFYNGQKMTADKFLSEYKHAIPDLWIYREICGYWGVDVYASQFPTSRGWQIYETANARILIIRMENLKEEWVAAFTELDDDKPPRLPHINATRARTIGGKAKEYKRFLQEEKIPIDYVKMCNEYRYMKHFYSDMIKPKAGIKS